MSINIRGLGKAELLAALYNASRQQGLGFMHARGAIGMTVQDAKKEISANPRMHFDYLHGRVMKVSLGTDDMEERLYDRDNGYGAAERAIATLRTSAPIPSEGHIRRVDSRYADDISPFSASMTIPTMDSTPDAPSFSGGGGEFSGAGASGSWDGGSGGAYGGSDS